MRSLSYEHQPRGAGGVPEDQSFLDDRVLSGAHEKRLEDVVATFGHDFSDYIADCGYLQPQPLRLHRKMNHSLIEARERSEATYKLETLKDLKLALVHGNQNMCMLFSLCPFFPLGFWDEVFSEAHMSKLQRTFLATEGWIVDMSLLTRSATQPYCASRDQIVEALMLEVRLRPSPKARDPFV
jgi:hypothetical protein